MPCMEGCVLFDIAETPKILFKKFLTSPCRLVLSKTAVKTSLILEKHCCKNLMKLYLFIMNSKMHVHLRIISLNEYFNAISHYFPVHSLLG